ncbi:MAG: hypothetical protein OER95_03260, partial [Acidimicrobiia bacterium]|nr:hypothetical protein [Acidimicrobiia bacterium]
GAPTRLGSVSAADVPATFMWYTELGPDNLVCGLNEIANAANILNVEGVELALSRDMVLVDVTCPDSCTLTAGYWMTHNPEFWDAHNGHGPPQDDAWYQLGDKGAGELFPFGDTGLTYYQIMRTPPKGDPWMQLAFQYIAAKLNVLNGADTGAVDAALTEAERILREYPPGTKGKQAKALRAVAGPIHSLLAAYNEGRIGPGHCDEDGWSTP